jgi:hypothetical protein
MNLATENESSKNGMNSFSGSPIIFDAMYRGHISRSGFESQPAAILG